MSKNRHKPKLPPFVVVKMGHWFVRRGYPTAERYPNGAVKYVQVVRRCFPETFEHAAGIVAAINREMEDGVGPATLAVGDFLSDFIAAKKLSVADRTAQDYNNLATRYVTGSAFAGLDAQTVTPIQIQEFYRTLAWSGTSGAMVRKLHTLLSMAFKQGIRWGKWTVNPCHGVLLPKKGETEIEIMSHTEARGFVRTCYSRDRWLVLMFALESGTRPGEYLSLAWDSVDLDNRTVSIKRSVTFPKGGFKYVPPKTPKSRRLIEISPNLCERLRKHRDEQARHLVRLRADLRKPIHLKDKGVAYERRKQIRANKRERLAHFALHNLVFPSAQGTPMSPTSLGRYQMKEVCNAAGIGSHSLYSLRHSSATLALTNGANVKAVSERLGHADVRITLQTYTHVLPQMRNEATEKLAEALY